MADPLILFIAVLGTLFVVVDPPGSVPFFLAITKGYTAKEKRSVINKAIISATALLAAFAFLGDYIFALFSITIPAFQIAGGILLFKMGFDMLSGMYPKTKQTESEQEEAIEKEAVGIVPLGIPMISGPGAIVTTMIYISQNPGIVNTGIVLLAVAAVMGITYALLRMSDRFYAMLGTTGTLALVRIMGLLVAVVAVQFVITGALTVMSDWYATIAV